MWVITETGFVSAVEDEDDPSILKVRARDKASLTSVLTMLRDGGHSVEGISIVEGAGTDYRYRLYLPRELFGAFLLETVEAVDYPNFKNSITAARGRKWHDALMDIWVTLLKVDDGKKNPRRSWDLSGSLGR